MSDAENKTPIDRLVNAYESMLEHVHDAIEQTRESSIPGLREYLDDAREKLAELGELTREEAEKVAGYIERDVKDAARHLAENGAELSRWWRFDVEQVERRLLETFSKVADKTRVELDRLAGRAGEATLYHTGEVTGPGTLVCVKCGKEMHFRKAGHIPPCSACHGTEFRRAGD